MMQPVTVTERAATRIKQILASESHARMLRVSVEGGGCSGFSYKFDLVGQPEADDIVIERSGATVLVNPVRMSDGFISSHTISTMRLPVRYAICWRSR